MRTRAQVAVVARDPGAAAVLAPVAGALQRARLDPHTSALTDAAAAAFVRAGTQHGRADPPPADVLVSGTSTRPDLDAELWDHARSDGARVVVVVDHWTALADRFTAGTPDVICVIDSDSRSELIRLGVAADRVIVVGHPALDDVMARPTSRIPGGDGRVAFVSEPLSLLPAPPLINEHRGADILCAALAAVPSPLLVRPHPREDPSEVAQRFNTRASVAVHMLAGDPLPELVNVTAAFGMGSMLLVETALMGTPVAALRTEREATTFPGSALAGLIQTVSSADDCIAFLRRARNGTPPPDRRAKWAKRHDIDGKATERIVQEIHRLLQGLKQ